MGFSLFGGARWAVHVHELLLSVFFSQPQDVPKSISLALLNLPLAAKLFWTG